MQTVSKCKIKGKGKLSVLSKGMTVYRYSKDELNKTPKAGETKKIGNIEMVLLPGGTFQMGSNESEDEKPIHKVTVDSFWMGKYEVTQEEYEEIMGSNPSELKGKNLPVETVSWEDAVEFCKKFSEKYNVKARLPYEAEWEYACRGGTKTKYHWGDSVEFSVVDQYEVYVKNSYDKGSSSREYGINKVGSRKPNAFGLYDMSGNVSEWCADWYGGSYYKSSPSKNPVGVQTGSFRVLRGGTWSSPDGRLRSSIRIRANPRDSDGTLGFRVVVSR
jgi:formylglycine-generating enzyme required for sulfatase activity